MFTSEIKESLLKVLENLGIVLKEEEIVLEHPENLGFGDYSSNIAMELGRKQGRNPKELAEKIVSKWQEIGLPEFVDKVEVAGAGFLNIWLKFGALGNQLIEVLKRGDDYGRGLKPAKTKDNNVLADFGLRHKTMVIDYSAPNIAKPFGIGHLRSTNIGQAIYNLYKFLGWQVIGDNHLGDWGTQFGKLIYQIVSKTGVSPLTSSNILSHPLIKNLTIEELEKLYVEFHKEAETKPEMEEEARKWFKKLEDGDPLAKAIWQVCVDISLKEFNRIYDLLGIKIDVALGESFYLDKMEEVLADCRQKGILQESQGAQVVAIPGMKIPAMLVKSDGATTYLLRDLAAIKYRIKTWRPDLIVYEVGADQSLHFQQLFNLAVQLGYGNLKMFVHVAHGLIRWKKGKFSTRKGETIHLEEVLNEAIERAGKLAAQTGQEKSVISTDQAESEAVEESLSKDDGEKGSFDKLGMTGESDKIAKAVGIGAIKYNDLKQNPKTDIVFDWDQILSLQGNSGPYLQYTYARTQSVLAKSQNLSTKFQTNPKFKILNLKQKSNGVIEQLNNEEIFLLRTIYRFPEIVEEAARQFSPNLLCNFLFDLAQKFNLFYDKHRILPQKTERRQSGTELIDEQSNFRLTLTAAVGQVLKNGLGLLGIEALEKM